MHELTLHIEYLLKRHDCVIVPGFGAFLADRVGAVYDGDTVSPASVEIRFNAAVCNDDGLVASSFARRLRIPYEEAKIRLLKSVEMLNASIESQGEITVGRLGTIIKGEENTLQFRPFGTAASRAEMLGMPPLRFPDMGSKQAKRKDGMNRSDRQFHTDRNYYIPVNKTFVRLAACVALVMAVALSLWTGSQSLQNDRQYASVVPIAPVGESIRKATAPADEPKRNLAEEPAVAEENTAEPERYHLIVATFRSISEADNFIKSHDDPALTAVSSGKMVRVSAASSSDREALVEKMRSTEFRSSNSDIWNWERP